MDLVKELQVKKYNVSQGSIWSWRKKYLENGIEGLKSNTGKKRVGAKKEYVSILDVNMK